MAMRCSVVNGGLDRVEMDTGGRFVSVSFRQSSAPRERQMVELEAIFSPSCPYNDFLPTCISREDKTLYPLGWFYSQNFMKIQEDGKKALSSPPGNYLLGKKIYPDSRTSRLDPDRFKEYFQMYLLFRPKTYSIQRNRTIISKKGQHFRQSFQKCRFQTGSRGPFTLKILGVTDLIPDAISCGVLLLQGRGGPLAPNTNCT